MSRLEKIGHTYELLTEYVDSCMASRDEVGNTDYNTCSFKGFSKWLGNEHDVAKKEAEAIYEVCMSVDELIESQNTHSAKKESE